MKSEWCHGEGALFAVFFQRNHWIKMKLAFLPYLHQDDSWFASWKNKPTILLFRCVAYGAFSQRSLVRLCFSSLCSIWKRADSLHITFDARHMNQMQTPSLICVRVCICFESTSILWIPRKLQKNAMNEIHATKWRSDYHPPMDRFGRVICFGVLMNRAKRNGTFFRLLFSISTAVAFAGVISWANWMK